VKTDDAIEHLLVTKTLTETLTMTIFISVLCDVTFNYVKNCIPRVSGAVLAVITW